MTLKLTRVERWILSNQYYILEALRPEESDGFREKREALESGYELHYEPEHIYDDPMSEEECREVLDVLDMHRALHDSYQGLADKGGIDEHDVKFWGFDGNNEARLLSYTRYFCGLDDGRYVELDRGDGFNSHAPALEMYRRMLAVWRDRLRGKHDLSKEEIRQIIAARVYPKG